MKNDKQNKRGLLVSLIVWVLMLAMITFWITPRLLYESGLIGGTGSSFAGIAVEPENTIEVVALGDSECFSSFSPLQLWNDHGIVSYNCGESGQDMAEAYSMLHTVYKTQSPKVVLLETNALYSSATAMKGAQVVLAERIYNLFPTIRFHNAWKNLVQETHAAAREKGFQIRPSVMPYTGGEYMDDRGIQAPLEENNIRYLKKMTELCKAHNASLVLYTSPSALNHSLARHNEIEDVAQKDGIEYLDLNMPGTVEMDWSKDTVDAGDHVNISGAMKVTEYIGHYLVEKFNMADHRGEEEYSSWNQAADKYMANITRIIDEIRNG